MKWEKSRSGDDVFKAYRREYKKRLRPHQGGDRRARCVLSVERTGPREKDGVRSRNNLFRGIEGLATAVIKTADGLNFLFSPSALLLFSAAQILHLLDFLAEPRQEHRYLRSCGLALGVQRPLVGAIDDAVHGTPAQGLVSPGADLLRVGEVRGKAHAPVKPWPRLLA